MGQFIGTYKPDGYNTEEELETMGLVGRHDPDFDEVEDMTCQCKCCEKVRELGQGQMYRDELSRAKLKLRTMGQYRAGGAAALGKRKTEVILNAESFDSKIKYTGDHEFTELDKIYARYGHHEFLVFMEDNAVVLFDTIHGGFCWDSIVRGPERNSWYAEAVSPNGPHVEIFDIFIPGATKIFVKEL